MQFQLEQLDHFQRTFRSHFATSPTLVDKEVSTLRYNLLLEELNEYKEACENGDLVEVLDAIVDILFLTFGTAITHGMDGVLEEAWNRVVENNMSKEIKSLKLATDSVQFYQDKGVVVHIEPTDEGYLLIRDSDGKIMKPAGFQPVDLTDLILESYKGERVKLNEIVAKSN